MIAKIDKNTDRKRRHNRVRQKISGTADCPRMNVYRSLSHIYVQFVNDDNGTTLASASSVEKGMDKELKGKSKKEKAKLIGLRAAKKAQDAGIKTVVFDRGGYLYTGRVKELADGAREGGLQF